MTRRFVHSNCDTDFFSNNFTLVIANGSSNSDPDRVSDNGTSDDDAEYFSHFISHCITHGWSKCLANILSESRANSEPKCTSNISQLESNSESVGISFMLSHIRPNG